MQRDLGGWLGDLPTEFEEEVVSRSAKKADPKTQEEIVLADAPELVGLATDFKEKIAELRASLQVGAARPTAGRVGSYAAWHCDHFAPFFGLFCTLILISLYPYSDHAYP